MGGGTMATQRSLTPMNLFAIRKVESVRLPEGLEYTLSSFWIECNQALL